MSLFFLEFPCCTNSLVPIVLGNQEKTNYKLKKNNKIIIRKTKHDWSKKVNMFPQNHQMGMRDRLCDVSA